MEPVHIPLRRLRNDVSAVLAEVAGGARFRVTVRGRPVAELIPAGTGRRFAPRADVERIVAETPLDRGFADQVDAVLGGTIEEL